MTDPISFLAVFVLPGAVGGAVRGLVGMAKHVYQNKETLNIWKFLFSLIVAIIAGAVAAVLTEGDWRVALLAGFAGSDLIESMYKSKLLGGLLKAL